MRVFYAKYPDFKEPSLAWYKRLENCTADNLAELRQTFNSADSVGKLTIFNIKGNHYRIATRIVYRHKVVYIRRVMTHAEYDKGDWKNDEWNK